MHTTEGKPSKYVQERSLPSPVESRLRLTSMGGHSFSSPVSEPQAMSREGRCETPQLRAALAYLWGPLMVPCDGKGML